MGRGRRAHAPELKELKGNPGKRRLAVRGTKGSAAAARPIGPQPPDYLTQPTEREFFQMALATLPPNLARASDVHSIARWAAWLNTWVICKIGLEKTPAFYESVSAHGTFYREHPLARRIDRAEYHLLALEDRIGLNVVARNNIVHRLFNMPAPPIGGLFGDEKPSAEMPNMATQGAETSAADPATDGDPIGFLQAAAKLH